MAASSAAMPMPVDRKRDFVCRSRAIAKTVCGAGATLALTLSTKALTAPRPRLAMAMRAMGLACKISRQVWMPLSASAARTAGSSPNRSKRRLDMFCGLLGIE